jgi:hypothetical protein
MSVLTLAISWEPEIRGIFVVLIGFTVLCGSVFLILGTNMGARLGLLTAFAALFGWMAIMGVIWSIYGIGLRGQDPTWVGVQVINGELDQPDTKPVARNLEDGWTLLAESDPGRGQAIASADDILQNKTKRFRAGEYLPLEVFDKGGDRWPMIGDFDLIAFFHRPHYALVQVQPVIPVATEPGKAPPVPQVDPSAPKTYVLMLRDLGTRRRPAALITIGSATIFAALCLMLHRRDQRSKANVAAGADAVAGAGPPPEKVTAGV